MLACQQRDCRSIGLIEAGIAERDHYSRFPHPIFNVSSGEGRSIKDVYNSVRAHLGLPADPAVKIVPVGDDDVPSVVPDPSMTEKILDWKAEVAFSETMKRMLSWYDAHGASGVRPGARLRK